MQKSKEIERHFFFAKRQLVSKFVYEKHWTNRIKKWKFLSSRCGPTNFDIFACHIFARFSNAVIFSRKRSSLGISLISSNSPPGKIKHHPKQTEEFEFHNTYGTEFGWKLSGDSHTFQLFQLTFERWTWITTRFFLWKLHRSLFHHLVS